MNADTQQKLLLWYRKHRRDLPWRRTSDPYKIWVSEIMLQQTTVETVIPYYEKFLKRFPTVASLAVAPEDEVIRFWSGLGYYSRARNLHQAAQRVMEKFHGELPSRAEDLIKLPGIGRYTAGAIGSIAFGKRTPILDGNVVRVLSRFFTLVNDPKSTEGQKIFWQKAEEVLPKTGRKKDFGDFNQALMELGATVCLPEKPLCLMCPVSSFCRAYQKGDAAAFPKMKKKVAYRDVIMSAVLIEKEGKLLLVQRPAKGLLRGMWELPMVEGDSRELIKHWQVKLVKQLPSVRHSVLNRRLVITPFVGSLQGELATIKSQWIFPDEIKNVPTSSMNRKLINRFIASKL
ncbi:MAG: A/G-specific adenine glycosylase [Deltaproteobacteria bacterium]|nr:A/G-specific adenine glycosylase [Deltaproteobacteria bacterium]